MGKGVSQNEAEDFLQRLEYHLTQMVTFHRDLDTQKAEKAEAEEKEKSE